jgi:hypothetical protein
LTGLLPTAHVFYGGGAESFTLMGANEIEGVFNSNQFFRFFVGNINIELLFHGHDQLYKIE